MRPIFLNLFQIKFPITAIISFLHRVSGLLLFVLIPVCLYLLQMSVDSLTSYNKIISLLNHPLNKIIFICILSPTIYHIIAGVRHMMMDCGLGESKQAARITAYIVLILSIIIIISIGVKLW